MTMYATVLRVRSGSLLVLDRATSQEVVVHTQDVRCFRAGDQVCIRFNGVMAQSLPPQITADCITKISFCGC